MSDVTFQQRLARAQFGEMLIWLNRGWQKAPAGRKCPDPDCGGAVWLKVIGNSERHVCSVCGWAQDYRTK